MKRTALTIILALLLSAVSGTLLVKEGAADPFPPPGVEITIENPQNTTYNVSTIPVVFSAAESWSRSWVEFSYSLDNKERKEIANITTISEEIVPINPGIYFKTMSGSFVLFNLSEGWHSLTIYSQSDDPLMSVLDVDTVDFLVDTIPILSLLSFENRTFESSDVPLNFTGNQLTSQITYSLDGQGNVTIGGNITLTELPNGEHNITVYATDETGNVGASETVYFVVQVPKSLQPEAFTILPIATASTVLIALISIGLTFYFKKRKKS